MVYWHATKEHNSFWSNNEQVANRCIGNELYGSDSTNIEKGKASREKWALHLKGVPSAVGFPHCTPFVLVFCFLGDVKVPHRRAFLVPCTLS